MPREGDVLGQAGISIPDVYDVVGSQAPIDRLSSSEPQYVHELGHTLFSERLNMTIRRISSGAIAQNTDFNIVLSDFPSVPFRIHKVVVISNVVARLNRCSVLLRDELANREMPLFAWDVTDDAEFTVRMEDDGGGVANQTFYRPLAPPDGGTTLALGDDARQFVGDIALRGSTSGFGAGTIIVVALLQISFANLGGVSSYGLPIPGW